MEKQKPCNQRIHDQSKDKIISHIQTIKEFFSIILIENEHADNKNTIMEYLDEIANLYSKLQKLEKRLSQLNVDEEQKLNKKKDETQIHKKIFELIWKIMLILKQKIYVGTYLYTFIKEHIQSIKYPQMRQQFQKKVKNLHCALYTYILLVVIVVSRKNKHYSQNFQQNMHIFFKKVSSQQIQITMMNQKDKQFMHDPIFHKIIQQLKNNYKIHMQYQTELLHSLNSGKEQNPKESLQFWGLLMFKKMSQNQQQQTSYENQYIGDMLERLLIHFFLDWFPKQEQLGKKNGIQSQYDAGMTAFMQNKEDRKNE